MVTEKTPFYECVVCGIKTAHKKDFSKHLLTAKHLKRTKNDAPGDIKIPIFDCKTCKKIYKSRNGLWKHSKLCVIEPFVNTEVSFLTKLVLDVVKNNTELQKQNQELHKQMIEVCKQGNHTNNIIHSNSHNKTFNLQFFLNETCKDAMNIMEFVDSFTLQLSDLESVSKQGYVDGISTIIVNKLNEMDIHKRPIHCSDAKREIMYVKDQNKWEKEEPGYAKLRKAIKYISKKNSDLLFQWSDAHPASKNITSQTNTEYMMMIMQAMGGKGEIVDSENKIIKKIAKTVLIEKQ